MELSILIEISSDVCGALGSFILLFPTIRVIKQRKIIHEEMIDITSQGTHDKIPDAIAANLLQILRTADEKVSGYVPNDAKLLLFGVGFLITAFVLKILFHLLTKL